MIHEMKLPRKYRMKQRAESQARTRERIVEAAVRLHQERGVIATTISDIAERAGVERLTVYRHFPDELSLLRGCSSHWLGKNPFPDPAKWEETRDPVERTQLALSLLYAYFGRTEAMWSSILKEEQKVQTLGIVMKDAHEYFNTVAMDLASAWRCGEEARGKLLAALNLSIQFCTWQSLKKQKLKDAEITDLMLSWFCALTAQRKSRRASKSVPAQKKRQVTLISQNR